MKIKQGSVGYFQHRHLTSSQSHFFIVLNNAPESGKVLFLSVITSQVDKAKKRCSIHPQETLVIITPDEYSELSKESAVDCNNYFELDLEEFQDKCASSKSRKKDIPQDILDRIVNGILKSRLIPPNIKKQVSPTWEATNENTANKRNDQS